MDELLKIFSYQGGQGDQLHLIETLAAILLSFACAWCIAQVYRFTHRGAGYSQSYVQSLILMAMVTTLIMIVIGSNIARAFSLVGALSIIRFRNAVKETRDVAFIFFVMAIAMACGTRFYMLAMLATALNSFAIVAMYMTNFANSKSVAERLITIQLPPGQEPELALEPTFKNLFESWQVISIESVRQGLFQEIIYSVRPLPNVTGSQVLDGITRVNGNLKVTYNYSGHTDEL